MPDIEIKMRERTLHTRINIIQLMAAVLLAVSFFLPWVNWDGNPVKGMDMASGKFFLIADARFGVANPFPRISFLFYVFWLIPLLSLLIAFFSINNKQYAIVSFLTGALSLSLVTVYILFSNTLIDLGAGSSVISMIKPFMWVHALAAIVLIITAGTVKNTLWKLLWLVTGPLIAFTSFKMGEKYIMGQTHQETQDVKTDFKIEANTLIAEFLANDSAANRKYVEKILEVDGRVAAVDILPDSSATIKFADSTGSYAIFSFDKQQMNELKSVQPGTSIIVKGVCSGSIFSEILGTTSISFKRSTLYKK
jgi:hypothetical protein